MKKYTTINFLEKNKQDNKKSRLYNIAIMILVVYLGGKVYYNLSEVQNLQNYIDKNTSSGFKETLPVMSYEDNNIVDISKIQQIYNKLGRTNVISVVVDKSNIEVEGKCSDLNILNNIKQYEYIKDMSVNKIEKQGEAYVFNVSYKISE